MSRTCLPGFFATPPRAFFLLPHKFIAAKSGRKSRLAVKNPGLGKKGKNLFFFFPSFSRYEERKRRGGNGFMAFRYFHRRQRPATTAAVVVVWFPLFSSPFNPRSRGEGGGYETDKEEKKRGRKVEIKEIRIWGKAIS